MSLSAVAAYLQFLRKGQGLSQEQLALQVGLPPLIVERLERAEGEVTPDALERIVAGLGASRRHVEHLLGSSPAGREEASQLIRSGIDLAKGWLRGEDLLEQV